MPEVRFSCPACSATLKGAGPLPAGKKIKCPKCGAVISVPAGGQAGPDAAAVARKELRRRAWAFLYRRLPQGEGTESIARSMILIYADQDRSMLYSPQYPKVLWAAASVAGSVPADADDDAKAYYAEQAALLQVIQAEVEKIAATEEPPEPAPPDLSFLDDLDEVDWADLSHAEGPAADTPGLLRQLAAADDGERDRAVQQLGRTVVHKGVVYSASVEAASFLVGMLETPGFPDKFRLVQLLKLLYEGVSHNRLRGRVAEGNVVAEYDLRIGDDPDWAEGVQRHVRAGLPVYLQLLSDDAWKTRLHAPALIQALKPDVQAVRPAYRAALEEETHLLCRAHLLYLAIPFEEPMLPRWRAGLSRDPAPLVRFVAALVVIHQEKNEAPADALDVVLQVLASPDPSLADQYWRLPPTGDLTAEAGGVLTWGPRKYVVAGLKAMFAVLEREEPGDHTPGRVQAMLNLACTLTDSNPFADPTSLNDFQRQTARAAHQLLRRASGHAALTGLLGRYGLPESDKKFVEYLQRAEGKG